MRRRRPRLVTQLWIRLAQADLWERRTMPPSLVIWRAVQAPHGDRRAKRSSARACRRRSAASLRSRAASFRHAFSAASSGCSSSQRLCLASFHLRMYSLTDSPFSSAHWALYAAFSELRHRHSLVCHLTLAGLPQPHAQGTGPRPARRSAQRRRDSRFWQASEQ